MLNHMKLFTAALQTEPKNERSTKIKKRLLKIKLLKVIEAANNIYKKISGRTNEAR